MVATAVRITVKVVPRASRDAVLGWKEDVLRVAVTAAPERGRANEAIIRVLAERLEVPRGSVALLPGHTSPRKVIEINGLNEATVKERLATPGRIA